MTRRQRDPLILDHLPIVKAIAVRIHEELPVHVNLDDLVQAGVLGLMDAADKFDKAKNVKFGSYAKHRVKGAILDSLRQLDWASRDMRRLQKRVEVAKRELAAKLMRFPTDAEIAKELGMTEARWRAVSIDLRNIGLVSASTRPDANDDLPAPDLGCKPNEYPDAICFKTELGRELQVALAILPPRYRQVVQLYYNREMTMKEIGWEMGINESRVSQIHRMAMDKLHQHFCERKMTFAALA